MLRCPENHDHHWINDQHGKWVVLNGKLEKRASPAARVGRSKSELLVELAAQVGLKMNRDKTVLILVKVKSKQTTGSSQNPAPFNRLINPFTIKYSDGDIVKVVEAKTYLSSRLTRSASALPELRRRVALGYSRANDLKRV